MSSHYPRTYLTAHCVKDAEFNVKLEYQSAVVAALPVFADFVARAGDHSTTESTSIICERLTLKWQQKIPHPCVAGVAESQDVPNIRSSGNIRRIFTYVDGEQLPDSLKVKNETPMAMSKRNSISERISSSRHRRIAPTSYGIRNAVIDLPLKENIIKSRSIHRLVQTMFIMAYLGPLDKDRESCDSIDEHVICKITAINETVIVFQPDISPDGVRLESRYGIYNAMVAIDEAKFDQISLMEQEDDWIQSREGANLFDVAEEGVMKFDYLIQIERAINFTHDGLYVEYKVELPNGLFASDVKAMSGKTQLSYTKADGQCYFWNDAATFAYTIQLSLSTKQSQPEAGFFSPRILFRVCAENVWGGHYVDGYGITSMPLIPGRHKISVNCWRPVDPKSRTAALQERFVAQAIDIKSFDQCTFNSAIATMGNKVSWIGLTTEGCGEVELQVDCIVQSRKFISQEDLQQMKYGTMMKRIGLHSNIHWRILKALLDFEEAKKHLLQVRSQPVPRLYFNM
ncbi:Meckel syndrome type 1 -like protein [Toxocara canis]|uniref:Meckel syndrome type 1-like protein n=1 Tax=Toxocara canis TaxID=6265 RepID=A0A0B2VAS7_TOXCA|nr:Meckel syndrome type 1 -like protein [Toxocara canis]